MITITLYKLIEGIGYIVFQSLILIVFFLVMKYLNKIKKQQKKGDINGF